MYFSSKVYVTKVREHIFFVFSKSWWRQRVILKKLTTIERMSLRASYQPLRQLDISLLVLLPLAVALRQVALLLVIENKASWWNDYWVITGVSCDSGYSGTIVPVACNTSSSIVTLTGCAGILTRFYQNVSLFVCGRGLQWLLCWWNDASSYL